MPEIAKRKYVGAQMRYNKKITHALNELSYILPANYTKEILLSYFMKYFPFEWKELVEMQELHKEKDTFLNSVGKKRDIDLLTHMHIFTTYKKLSILRVKFRWSGTINNSMKIT